MGRWDTELGELLARRGGALVGYAYVLCGNRDEAEDLVQEALVRVFSRWRRPEAVAATGERSTVRVETSGGVEGYVRAAVLNVYLDGYRRRRRWDGVRHRVVVDDRQAGPASGVTVRADVALALAGLSPRQRACVVLRYFEDLTVPQIAVALGVAEGTVKRHLHEAVAALRGVLGTTAPVAAAVAAPITTEETR